MDEQQEGWGKTDPSEEELERVGFEAQRTAALDGALLSVAENLAFLPRIYEELKRVNDYIINSEKTDVVGVPPAVERAQTPSSVIPTNLKTEDEISKFYLDGLATVMDDKLLKRVRIAVEEKQVVLRTPFMEDGWGAVAEVLNGLGGEYVSDGRNTRWIMPHP
jgi:hypothetical protein